QKAAQGTEATALLKFIVIKSSVYNDCHMLDGPQDFFVGDRSRIRFSYILLNEEDGTSINEVSLVDELLADFISVHVIRETREAVNMGRREDCAIAKNLLCSDFSHLLTGKRDTH